MSHNRRKWKPDLRRRIDAVRNALANQYGNLFGLKLRDWFVFNRNVAGISQANLRRFEATLAARRNARGTSANHRERRERERTTGVFVERSIAALTPRRRRGITTPPPRQSSTPIKMAWVEKRRPVPVDDRRKRQGVSQDTQDWLIDRAAAKRARRAGVDPDSLTRKEFAKWRAAA